MENLTPDTKYLLAEQLSGEDLVKFCSTNASMRQICSSSRYDQIWKDKLKKDFNMNYIGDNPYMMYLQHTYFYKETYWVAIEREENIIIDTKLFRSWDEAVQYLFMKIMKKYEVPFSVLETNLIIFGNLEIADEPVVEITTADFRCDNNCVKEFYNRKLREIGKSIYKNTNTEFRREVSEEIFINNFINDFELFLKEYILNANDRSFISADSFIEFFIDNDNTVANESKLMIRKLLEDPNYIFE